MGKVLNSITFESIRWFMYLYCLRLKTDLSSDSSENEDGNKFSAISSPSAIDDDDVIHVKVHVVR